MTATTDTPTASFRLAPSLALALIAIAVALVFCNTGGRSSQADQGYTTEQAQHAPAEHADNAAHPADHDEHASPATLKYYSGGLWSPNNHLAGLSELALLATSPQQNIICQSVSWDAAAQKMIVTDVSPIKTSQRTSKEDKTLAVISVDHAGVDIDAEFAIAIQDHLAKFADASTILIITPLPGPDPRPEGEFPYDWSFLDDGEKVKIIDWVEVKPLEDIHGLARSGYVRAWVELMQPTMPILDQKSAEELVINLDVISDPMQAAQAIWALSHRSPYEVVPAFDRRGALDPLFAASLGLPRLSLDALVTLRVMGIHADDLITIASTSEDPAIRALAARAIGNLADITTDPLGRLTKLAEDKDQRVRYEALVACRALPGRRAAGVAQLVEPYAMSDDMRSLYNATMTQLLTYGEPIPADSRVNRLRRMALSELLSQERDAIVCAILLERTDLPDDKIGEVLTQLATANGNGPLTALLNLLETMNPATILKREVLMRTLADWKANEVDAQQTRFVELIAQDSRPEQLKAAAAGALIRSLKPAEVLQLLGSKSVVFQGLRWVSDADILKAWRSIVIDTAMADANTLDGGMATKVAAFDAITSLPADTLTADDAARILSVARTSSELDLRFAAIRAINNLPDAIKPRDIDDLRLTSLSLSAVPGQIRFDKTALTAIAGRPVEITLVNPDNMEHNLAITRPGRMIEVGMAISTMNPADAAAIHYIPEGDAVMHHTAMLKPGQSETLRFIAPSTPGKYPYVCTFPGHYTSMNGVLEVVAP